MNEWTVKNIPAMQETWVQPLGQEDPLENGMTIHSSTLAWRNPWTEEPGRLQFMGLQRVEHNWATGHAHMSLSHSSLVWRINSILFRTMEKMKKNDKWNSEKRRACLDELERPLRDFPGGPVVKTHHPAQTLQVRSPVGSWDPTCLATKNPKHKTEWIL